MADKTEPKHERTYGEQKVRDRDDDAGVLVVNGLLEFARLGRLTDDTYDRLKALVEPTDDDDQDDDSDDSDDERQAGEKSDQAKPDATKAAAARKATR